MPDDRIAPFPTPAVTVDVVLIAILSGVPHGLLVQRAEAPFAGCWALPGGFVRIDEPVDDAAARVLREKADVAGVHVEQLYTFGAVARDPRMRVISIGHLALLPPDRFAAIRTHAGLVKARLDFTTSHATAHAWDGTALPLAFDHGEILSVTMRRLRGKLDYSDIGFALLPPEFTLRQLQDVHEALLGQTLNKPAFRRRMLDRGWLHATGRREAGTSHRPAELYRHAHPAPRTN